MKQLLGALGLLRLASWCTAFSGLDTPKIPPTLADEYWTPETVPNPKLNPAACRVPARQSAWFCDPEGLLTEDGRTEIVRILGQIRNSTEAPCGETKLKGYQVAVVVLSRISDSYMVKNWFGDDQVELTTKNFASAIGDTWLASDPCQDGIVLFLALKDEYEFLRTTPLTKKALPDDKAQRILASMKRQLIMEHFDEAILKGVGEINNVLQGLDISGDDGNFFGGQVWSQIQFVGFCIVAMLALCVLMPGLVVALPATAIFFVFLPFTIVGDIVLFFLEQCKAHCRSTAAQPFLRSLDDDHEEAEHDLQRVAKELDRSEFDGRMCPICLQDLPASAISSKVLECRHRYHEDCINQWLKVYGHCPLCRPDVDVKLVDEDLRKPESHVRRFKFYLSRLEERYSRFDDDGPIYYRDDEDRLQYQRNSSLLWPASGHVNWTSTVSYKWADFYISLCEEALLWSFFGSADPEPGDAGRVTTDG